MNDEKMKGLNRNSFDQEHTQHLRSQKFKHICFVSGVSPTLDSHDKIVQGVELRSTPKSGMDCNVPSRTVSRDLLNLAF